jgi:hypothetical protein
LSVDWTLTLSDVVVSAVTLIAAFFAAWVGGRIALKAAIDAVHEEARLEQQRRTEDDKQRQRERDEDRLQRQQERDEDQRQRREERGDDERRREEEKQDQRRIAISNLYHEFLSNAVLLESTLDPNITGFTGEPLYRPNYVVLDIWVHLDLTAYDAASPYFIWLGEDINRMLRVSRLKIKTFNAIATYNNIPKTSEQNAHPMMRSMTRKWLSTEEIDAIRYLVAETGEAIQAFMRHDLGMDVSDGAPGEPTHRPEP